jgi:hypothetical protein
MFGRAYMKGRENPLSSKLMPYVLHVLCGPAESLNLYAQGQRPNIAFQLTCLDVAMVIRTTIVTDDDSL